jgi:hypothetical protein
MSVTTTKPGRKAVKASELAAQHAADIAERKADRMRTRLRPQAMPHYIVSALALSACALQLAKYLPVEEATVALATASAALVVAVVMAWRSRTSLNSKKARTWAAVCAIGAAGWLGTVTAAGVSLDALGLLAAIGYALALPWWSAHRIPNTTSAEPKLDAAVYIERWAAKVAPRILSGSQLTNPTDFPSGIEFLLQLDPGVDTYQSALAVVPNLRGALKLLRTQDLIVEQHPNPLYDESCLLLRIVTRPTVTTAAKIAWPGPSTYKNGWIDLGPHTDGEGVGKWRVYTENSMWGGYLTGITGVGKSRVLDQLALSLAAAGNTTIWYADGQSGASSPGLSDWFDWSTDKDGAGVMLAAAVAILEFRQAENIVGKLEGFTPSADRPGLLIIIDECHSIFADKHMQAAAARIAREGRKCGIAIIAASQVPNVGVFGPGYLGNVLRSCLCAGNLGAMHTTQKGAGNLIPGLPVDPTTLPNIPGLVYLAARGEGARSAALRGYYAEDTAAEAAVIPMPGLDRGSATAGGTDYQQRHEVAEARLEAARAIVAAYTSGTMPAPGLTPTKPAAATPAPATPAGGEGGAVARAQELGLNVIAFPTFGEIAAAAAQDEVVIDGLTARQQAVLVSIAAGYTAPGVIAEDAGVSPRHVYNVLDQLRDAGHVTKTGTGKAVRYTLSHTGQAAIDVSLAG